MKMKMRAIAMVLPLAFLAVFSIAMPAGAQGGGAAKSSGAVINGKVYSFEKIADGVYYSTSSSLRATGGNHTVIVGDRDVFLVDSGTTPSAARALLEDIKLITDKPVRWVVNTHFHYDHTDGNSISGRRCRSSATNTSAMPSWTWTLSITSRSRRRSRLCRFRWTRSRNKSLRRRIRRSVRIWTNN